MGARELLRFAAVGKYFRHNYFILIYLLNYVHKYRHSGKSRHVYTVISESAHETAHLELHRLDSAMDGTLTLKVNEWASEIVVTPVLSLTLA